MTLATIQNLRTFNAGEHPTDLEPGQIAFNLSQDNFDLANANANIYMYVGNQSDMRLDEGGAVLVEGGTSGKGWVRYGLRSVRVDGDTMSGDLNMVGASVKISRSATDYAELIIPKVVDSPINGSTVGSVRWNENFGKLQAWDGAKWDNTSKVFVGDTAPANPSNGDMWLTTNPVPNFYVYVVPSSGPASWVSATSGGSGTALQPGNGVAANAENQIDTINSGSF